jgi:4-carboxymuconolactone decarboxylase
MRGLIRYSCPCAAWMATFLVQANPVHAQSLTPPPLTSEHAMASDIDPQSGFRLPLPRREDLDEAGQKAYDRGTTPGTTIAGLQGPAGVQLYSTRTAPHLAALNRYLRFEAGFSPRVRELAILATAREMDSQFEWVAHEPEALKEGVEQSVIDVIKYRKSTAGLTDDDATVI